MKRRYDGTENGRVPVNTLFESCILAFGKFWFKVLVLTMLLWGIYTLLGIHR